MFHFGNKHLKNKCANFENKQIQHVLKIGQILRFYYQKYTKKKTFGNERGQETVQVGKPCVNKANTNGKIEKKNRIQNERQIRNTEAFPETDERNYLLEALLADGFGVHLDLQQHRVGLAHQAPHHRRFDGLT